MAQVPRTQGSQDPQLLPLCGERTWALVLNAAGMAAFHLHLTQTPSKCVCGPMDEEKLAVAGLLRTFIGWTCVEGE